MMEKKPYLFYYEETVSSFVPAPDNIENIIDLDMLEDGERMEIEFKRVDLTQDEYDNLPDAG